MTMQRPNPGYPATSIKLQSGNAHLHHVYKDGTRLIFWYALSSFKSRGILIDFDLRVLMGACNAPLDKAKFVELVTQSYSPKGYIKLINRVVQLLEYADARLDVLEWVQEQSLPSSPHRLLVRD